MKHKPSVRKRGVVEKVIKPPIPSMPEKAQIEVEGAEPLYKEIRIENTLEDENGRKVKLKEGAAVEVVIEADATSTTRKSSDDD